MPLAYCSDFHSVTKPAVDENDVNKISGAAEKAPHVLVL